MAENDQKAVAFAVHDAYSGPTAVAATSILENSRGDFRFYVLDMGIGERSRERLHDVMGRDRTTFLTLPEAGGIDGVALSEQVHAKRLGKEMYAKFYLAELLSGRHDRFVYMDCDTLTVGDLSPLFDLRLEPYAVGAATCLHHPRADSPEGLPDYRELGLPPDMPCLDSGMLVVDTRTFVERRIGPRAIEYGRSHDVLPLGDLNALNAVLRGEWYRLGYEWNFQVYEPLRTSYSGPAPVTYHFSGRHKPFLLGSRFPDMQIMYDEYRRLCIAAGGPPF